MRRVGIVLLIVTVASAVLADEPSVTGVAGIATNIPGRRPLVVLKQVAISGRIFLIQENDTQLLREGIQVQVLESKEDNVVYETRTDKEGVFVLPSLDVGAYRLKTGTLTVALLVEDPEDVPGKIRLPKTILVFMPEEMRGSEQRGDKKPK